MEITGRKLSSLIGLGAFALIVAMLYWGRPLFIPLALSILFTFLLNPIVESLHRRGIGRAPAVLLVVILVSALLGGITWAMGNQLTQLADELPAYKENLRAKITDLRHLGKGTPLDRFQRTVQELIGEIHRDKQRTAAPAETDPSAPAPAEAPPVPVVVQGENTLGKILPSAVGPILTLSGGAGLVIVLVIFMLLRMQELRNRLIRLIGYGRLTTTTKALDEAGARISRYLLMQSLINASYGLAMTVGLYVIGLPYALLWGFFAALARFIPYLGPLLGGVLPILLSLAIFPGWTHFLIVLGFFLVIETWSNLIMEPLLYGHSAGVAEVPLLICIAFWTWLWGPIGLVLATPMTVCLVVLAKHVPGLEFVNVLMSDEPVMEHRLVFYQRLLAIDSHEASELLWNFLKAHPPELVYDELFIPALAFAKRDRHRKKLTETDEQRMIESLQLLLDELDAKSGAPGPRHSPSMADIDGHEIVHLIGLPVHDAMNESALGLLKHALRGFPWTMEIEPAEKLSAVQRKKPQAVCIAAVPPETSMPARYLCKKLREACPELKILIGRWSAPVNEEEQNHFLQSGADFVGFTLLETRNQLVQALQLQERKAA
jgi:predicted PurR-regulated permease PerM